MKLIPKFQSKGKLPDYYYQTTDTSDGTTYNVHPSAFGAKELQVTLPEVKVTARNPNHQYRSAFDPTAAWEPVHGVLNLMGKAFNKVTDATGTTEAASKVMPWIMPSQYVGWVRTGKRPGTEGNTGFGESKQDQYLNEMFDLGVAPAAMKGVGRTAKMAGKTFQYPWELLPKFGNKETYIPLFDKITPKTNVKITDLNGNTYRQLTPFSKYMRDRIFFSKEYKIARESGQYPRTFSERRQYLTDLRNEYASVRNRLINRRLSDYDYRHPYFKRATNSEDWRGMHYNVGKHDILQQDMMPNLQEQKISFEEFVPQDINITSYEGNRQLFPRENALGYYNKGQLHFGIRRKNSLLPANNKTELRGIFAHEGDHGIQEVDAALANTTRKTTKDEISQLGKNGYIHTVNENNQITYDDFEPIFKPKSVIRTVIFVVGFITAWLQAFCNLIFLMTAIRKIKLQIIHYQVITSQTTDFCISNDRFGLNIKGNGKEVLVK